MSQNIPCAFCKESVRVDALVCRHCKRSLAYSLELVKVLNERECLEFLKQWSSIAQGSKYLKWSNFKDAKESLKTPPIEIAWELTHEEAHQIKKRLSRFELEAKISTGISAASSAEHRLSAHGFSSVVGALFILLGVGIAFWWVRSEAPEPLPASRSEEQTYSSNQHLLNSAPPTLTMDSTPETRDLSEYPVIEESKKPEDKSLSRDQMSRLLDATVFIRGPSSLGTGFLISSDGFILSNTHVTKNMDSPVVLLRNGESFRAKKIKEDGKVDLSLIKIDARRLPYLELGDANQLYPGQNVLTIGNPSGLSFSVTRGIVSFLGREIDGASYIQTDAAINPGNSGGPMITEDMKVVGVNTLTARGQSGISFALPINYAYQAGGIARGIGSAPREQPEFKVNQTDRMVASLHSGAPGPQTPDDLYEKEAQSLSEELKRRDQEIRSEYDRLESELAVLAQKRGTLGHDRFKAQSVDRDIDRVQNRLRELSQQHKEIQIRYLDQMISIFQRQKADSRFAAYAAKIDENIEKLQDKKRSLENP